ncbi:hypothetical protein HWC80_gp088 [Mycobacterium phage Indlulamithi]|uniref:Uncharacterized protein n=1 Tax=Mycobacterium phage Indlulamithi TaxID=2656582 RepID=A0A649VD35_9CAUD|nr:hypothetical protein HWC80_gp088 [Mycobacterium phage Indlulamithi]QGJ90124.1 hypothetical protein PBI_INDLULAMITHI_86 [Mycobacterium phage Indlulamithi]
MLSTLASSLISLFSGGGMAWAYRDMVWRKKIANSCPHHYNEWEDVELHNHWAWEKSKKVSKTVPAMRRTCDFCGDVQVKVLES